MDKATELTRGTTVTVSLGNYERPLVAFMFGRMVRLADIVANYRGDLYHDALWVEQFVAPGDVTLFYWSIRTSGTSIGTDVGGVRMSAEYMWEIAITQTRETWNAEFTILQGL